MTLPVLLFGAGMGTRMGALTADRPKPLVKVAGRTLLDHALELLNGNDIGTTVINVHYRPEMIRAHLEGRDVIISDETGQLLETGGGLRKAMRLLNGSPVLTINTDAVWDGPNPISEILEAWNENMEALLLTVPKGRALGHKGTGDFNISEDKSLARGEGEIYTGLQIIRTDDLKNIAETHFSMNILWDRIAARGGLFGQTYSGRWCDVGQPSSIEIAEQMIGYRDV